MFAGDRFGGIWLRPGSRLGTGGFFSPCVEPSSLFTTIILAGAVDRPNVGFGTKESRLKESKDF